MQVKEAEKQEEASPFLFFCYGGRRRRGKERHWRIVTGRYEIREFDKKFLVFSALLEYIILRKSIF